MAAGRPSVVVAGAGVVGLTVAVALREAGFDDVTVVARDEPTVSEVLGGLWLPYSTGSDERTLAWGQETYEWLEREGHPIVDYIHLDDVDPWWLEALPAGRVTGGGGRWVARVPLVQTPRHLAALRDRAGEIRHRDLASLAEAGGDVVVNCAGLAAGRLAGDDDTVVPARGQVVHVRAPAGTPCICDERDLTYVLPREDLCVLGGTNQPGDHDTRPREHETRAILERCTRLVPELEGAEVLGVRAGLRPHRPAGVRLERDGGVIHCYGHGGAGLTLSWGCAQAVVALVRDW